MTAKALLSQLSALPAEARQQVADFIAFLQTRHRQQKPANKRKPGPSAAKTAGRQRRPRSALRRGNGKRGPLSDEPFIGMWADRDDMRDADAWVRAVREDDWAARHG